MAKRNRRGGAADEFDGDEPYEFAGDDSDASDASDGDSEDRGKTSGESKAVSSRSTATATRFGFGPPGRFIREVVAELRKVIWPTRKELVTYAVVVVFFVAVMMSIIAGFDYGFARAVQWVFGS